MGIRDEDIARVRATTDIVGLIGEYVQLKQVGQRYRGLCPFHAEKTGSFYVNAVDGLYHCFGCQASGDAITFVREQEHLGFVEAVERLASKVGITLTYDNEGENRTRSERKRLIDLVEKAEDFYHRRLLEAPDAAATRKYLRSRGFDADEVKAWRLGWAPDEWDQMTTALKLSKKDLEGTGLGGINSRGRPYDFFRGRLLFPIHDSDGHALGFGGRIMPGEEGAKYMNTRQTPLYDKSRVLFALDRAKAGIVEADEVVVCEGYTDVTAFFRVGVPRAVATCGTALTDEHVQMLRKFARRIVLAFDADTAGQAAADRFYQWEAKFDLDVVVAALPPGVDPGDMAGDDPEGLVRAVADARPFLEFRLNRILDAADMSTAEHRARAAEDALSVVVEHPNDLVRDQYLMQVADRCRVDVARLRDRLRSGQVKRREPEDEPRRRKRSDDDGDPGPQEPGDDNDPGPRPSGVDSRREVSSSDTRSSPALEVLRLAVNRPGDVIDWLDEALFDEGIHLDAYRTLIESATIHEAIDSAPPDVAALLSKLAVEEPNEDPMDPLILLIHAAGRREQSRIKAADPNDLARLAPLGHLIAQLGLATSDRRDVVARELLTFVSQQGDV